MIKQVKSKNRNRMAGGTLGDGLRLATTNTSFDEWTIMSKKPRPQTSHW